MRKGRIGTQKVQGGKGRGGKRRRGRGKGRRKGGEEEPQPPAHVFPIFSTQKSRERKTNKKKNLGCLPDVLGFLSDGKRVITIEVLYVSDFWVFLALKGFGFWGGSVIWKTMKWLKKRELVIIFFFLVIRYFFSL